MSHLPKGWEEWASGAYVESGWVCLSPYSKEPPFYDKEAQDAIKRLRRRLGIEVDDGPSLIPGVGTVIVEGGRWASLTLLTGTPPHYPGVMGDAALEPLKPLVWQYGLQAMSGRDTVYKWLDCIPGGKELTVRRFLDRGPLYYLGDGFNDLASMELSGVIPVGFQNSIPEIQALAKQRGIYVDLPGPDGGVTEFFQRLNSGKL